MTSGKWGSVSRNEKPFKTVASTFSIEDGIITYGSRMVALPLLKRRIIVVAHDPIHASQENTVAQISKEFWWPEMNRDVMNYVNKCVTCLQHKPKFRKTLDTWSKENEPWKRVHMDHCVVNIRIISDAYSG